ncbi:GGDEF domain-containing protein [Larsenimonas rhizosphaerae]|uniref:diguanylate cyclase n=1 Tax=Larsenimonas rhizosphaerae TaxID=2944682 RepID=A0AA41ZHV2_9GAMM|nr:GGDEF domain-containing protein [Larsenimonas rhizosphaerae]MCX2524444.1 GGDEF domain-containing protein [Larsenimonas rhizosphaerae]
MIKVIRKCWSPGVAGNPGKLRRQIELCNQLGLFCATATLPYQLFYYFHDYAMYRGVFLSNSVFIVFYLSVLLLNHLRWHTTASNLLLLNSVTQLFVVTSFVGTNTGVSLFYFSFASVVIFLYQNLRKWAYTAIMASIGLLYLLLQFLYPGEEALTPVPPPWREIMYGGSVTGVLLLSGTILYLLHREVSRGEEELTLNNQYLEALSHTDALTGLANRRALDKALEREWSRLSRYSGVLTAIMCDVDHFKRFNDYHGHDGGDRCLQQIATVLKGVLSRPSDLAVRYGGEEFALVLPGTDEQGARLLGERLRRAVEQLHIANEGISEHASVTISVGASSIAHVDARIGAHGADRLFKRADQALYQAKANGRNQVVYLPY